MVVDDVFVGFVVLGSALRAVVKLAFEAAGVATGADGHGVDHFGEDRFHVGVELGAGEDVEEVAGGEEGVALGQG